MPHPRSLPELDVSCSDEITYGPGRDCGLGRRDSEQSRHFGSHTRYRELLGFRARPNGTSGTGSPGLPLEGVASRTAAANHRGHERP